MLNAIRILIRLLPFIFEIAQESDNNSRFNDLFWDDRKYGESLLDSLVKLLFFKGFTMSDVVSDKPGVQYFIWYAGIGSATSPPDSAAIINNRTETLRLLLTILSVQVIKAYVF